LRIEIGIEIGSQVFDPDSDSDFDPDGNKVSIAGSAT
jgi:hypothetical protein